MPKKDAVAGQLAAELIGRLSDLANIKRKREQLRAASRASNTVRAYESDWQQFEAWCAHMNYQALPAAPAVVADYIADHSTRHAPTTLRRRLVAIGSRHRVAGLADPTKTDEVRETARGQVRINSSRSPRTKQAITVELLRQLLQAIPHEPTAARDAALLLIGFGAALRRSELVGLDLADVRFDQRGLVLTLRRSKTDQEGRGREVAIACGQHAETDPVQVLRAWLEVRGMEPGPLFCSYNNGILRRPLTRLAPAMVAKAVKRAASLAGLDPMQFAGHSLRAGLVTSAHAAGVSDTTIMCTTGHKSVQTLRQYVRHRDAFAACASTGLL